LSQKNANFISSELYRCVMGIEERVQSDRPREMMRHAVGIGFGVSTAYIFNALGFTEQIPLTYHIESSVAPYVQFGYEVAFATASALMIKGSLEPTITVR
jgi:hypothetical protein